MDAFDAKLSTSATSSNLLDMVKKGSVPYFRIRNQTDNLPTISVSMFFDNRLCWNDVFPKGNHSLNVV